jgi:hypothetical protein
VPDSPSSRCSTASAPACSAHSPGTATGSAPTRRAAPAGALRDPPRPRKPAQRQIRPTAITRPRSSPSATACNPLADDPQPCSAGRCGSRLVRHDRQRQAEQAIGAPGRPDLRGSQIGSRDTIRRATMLRGALKDLVRRAVW